MGTVLPFTDRWEAGALLAPPLTAALEDLTEKVPLAIYALPRGGVPVAIALGQRLNLPVGIIAAKKITLPNQPEFALGAVTMTGHCLWGYRPGEATETLLEQAQTAAIRRAQSQWQEFAPHCPPFQPQGRGWIVVDDGIATGLTMLAAIQLGRIYEAAWVWVCVPVMPPETVAHFQGQGARLLVLATPSPFNCVSRFYQDFPQLTNGEVIAQLQHHNHQFLVDA
jgi:predicted phosphoribosyltransferase